MMADGMVEQIDIRNIHPHPQNPRVAMRDDVVAAIAANLGGGFDPAHALIVRPVGDVFQVVSGHHRLRAAAQAGLSSVPCWVRDMGDEAAYMALATSNSQGELSPLEIGMHALGLDLDKRGRGALGAGGLKGYAKSIGKAASSISEYRQAALVANSINSDIRINDLQEKYAHLSAIHSLPESCWTVAVDAMISGGWSAADTAQRMKVAKEFADVDGLGVYTPADAIHRHFSYGEFSPNSYRRLIAQCNKVLNLIDASVSEERTGEYREAFLSWLRENKPWNIGDVVAYERRIEADLKKAALSADGFNLGDWRDHVGKLADGSVALLLTDPPYGMDYQSARRTERHDKITNDDGAEAHEELRQMLTAISSKMGENSHLLIFVDWRNEPAMREIVADTGYTIRGSLVWVKNVHGSGDLRGSFAPMHERIIHAVKGNPALIKRVPDVVTAAKAGTDRHPTEKPEALLAQLIEATTVEGELVADPFAGVASTLVAAAKGSRAFWGCEVSGQYHKEGVARL